MSSVYTIRVGGPQDDAACGKLRAAASIASPVFRRLPKAQTFLADDGPEPINDLHRFIAIADGKPAGFVDYSVDDGYIKMLFVDPTHQGQGLAAALLGRAGDAVLLPLHLRTQAVNDGALAFYLARGFAIVGGEIEPDWQGERVVWIKLSQVQ